MTQVIKDVHTEHCCLIHGCKYCDPDCTVTQKRAEQSFVCEFCYEFEELRSVAELKASYPHEFGIELVTLESCEIRHDLAQEDLMKDVLRAVIKKMTLTDIRKILKIRYGMSDVKRDVADDFMLDILTR